MIYVVNAKDFGRQDKEFGVDKSKYVYCARPSKYGNPFILYNESDRDSVISKFSEEVLPSIDISELVSFAREGDLYLGCYCYPKRCHCNVIKDRIESIIFK